MTKEEVENLLLVDCSSSEIELVNKAVDYIEELQHQLEEERNKRLKAIEYIKWILKEFDGHLELSELQLMYLKNTILGDDNSES